MSFNDYLTSAQDLQQAVIRFNAPNSVNTAIDAVDDARREAQRLWSKLTPNERALLRNPDEVEQMTASVAGQRVPE
jgi:acyl-CoA reductase-like NAD-dependent aldehyde dehydrogenase